MTPELLELVLEYIDLSSRWFKLRSHKRRMQRIRQLLLAAPPPKAKPEATGRVCHPDDKELQADFQKRVYDGKALKVPW